MKKWLLTLSAVFMAFSFTACDNERRNPLDEPGEAIEDGMEDAGDSLEEGGEDVKRSAEDATD